MYLLLLNKLQEQQHLQKQKFKCHRSTAPKPMDTNYGKQKKEKPKKKEEKQLKTYVTTRTY